MKLHHLTLKKAVEKYSGFPKETVKAEIAADPKGFDEDQVNEIYEAIAQNGKVQEKQPEIKPEKQPENRAKHIVSSEFRDQSDFNKKWEVGADVSHFDKERLKKLLELNLVKVL